LHALARAATVAIDRSDYFKPTARALLAHQSEGVLTFDELAEDLARDQAQGPYDDQQRTVLAFADKLTRHPYKITEKDAQSFRDAGLDDAAYVDVYNTVAIQSSLNRMANCVGVQADAVPLIRKDGR
jgi:alkylhydroperoxidase family enzyme